MTPHFPPGGRCRLLVGPAGIVPQGWAPSAELAVRPMLSPPFCPYGFPRGVGLPQQAGSGSAPSLGNGVFLYLDAWGRLAVQGIGCQQDRLPCPAFLQAGRSSGLQRLGARVRLLILILRQASAHCTGTDGPRVAQNESQKSRLR